MDLEQRARLVREFKADARRVPNSSDRNFDGFARRVGKDVDTDSDAYEANANWDKWATLNPSKRLKRVPRSSYMSDYSGYQGMPKRNRRRKLPSPR